MSKITNDSISIYEALNNIQNKKYVIPAFQRNYVWTSKQIEKLWDSILQGYPISTFLFWHLTDDNVTWDMNFSEFKKVINFDSAKKAEDEQYDLISIDTRKTDVAILDGQQRLTSLYLSLYGETGIREKYARKKTSSIKKTKLIIELNKNKIEDDDDFGEKKYDIRFTEKVMKLTPDEFEIKKIIDDKFMNPATREDAVQAIVKNVPIDSKEYAHDTLMSLCSKVFDEKLINYTLIEDMYQDDALEMFVRFNNGGTRIGKADITMSILAVYWPEAKVEFNRLLTDSYEGFGTDFLVRTALMIFGDVMKSNITYQVMNDLKSNWKYFRKALNTTSKILLDLNIDISRFKGSWNVLIPIVYSVYFADNYEGIDKEAIKKYLIRSILFTYFQSGTTTKLRTLRNNIINYNNCITVDMLDDMNELKVNDAKLQDLMEAEYKGRIAEAILYYTSLDWINNDLKYEQDHLHPHDRFWEGNPGGITPAEWAEWRKKCDKIPNLQYLEGRENASKSSLPLITYFNEMNEEQQKKFINEAIIPENVGLEITNFNEFYDSRKALLIDKLKKILC